MFFIKNGKLCPFFPGYQVEYPNYYSYNYISRDNVIHPIKLPPAAFGRNATDGEKKIYNDTYNPAYSTSPSSYYYSKYYWDNANYLASSNSKWAYARAFSQRQIITYDTYKSDGDWTICAYKQTDGNFNEHSTEIYSDYTSDNKHVSSLRFYKNYYKNCSTYTQGTNPGSIKITKNGFISIMVFASVVLCSKFSKSDNVCYITDSFSTNDKVDIYIIGSKTLGSSRGTPLNRSLDIRSQLGIVIRNNTSSDDRIKMDVIKPAQDYYPHSTYYNETTYNKQVFMRIPNLYMGRYSVQNGDEIYICMDCQRSTVNEYNWYEIYVNAVYFTIK